jgi:hypothetical protein
MSQNCLFIQFVRNLGAGVSYIVSVRDLLSIIEPLNDVKRRLQGISTVDINMNFPTYLTDARKIALGVLLVCHDGYAHYQPRQKFSATSINEGARLIETGVQNIFT